MPDKEKIGYHKGSIEVLLNERKEMARILQIVDVLLEGHMKALENEGVDVKEFLRKLREKQARRAQGQAQTGIKDWQKEVEEFEL